MLFLVLIKWRVYITTVCKVTQIILNRYFFLHEISCYVQYIAILLFLESEIHLKLITFVT